MIVIFLKIHFTSPLKQFPVAFKIKYFSKTFPFSSSLTTLQDRWPFHFQEKPKFFPPLGFFTGCSITPLYFYILHGWFFLFILICCFTRKAFLWPPWIRAPLLFFAFYHHFFFSYSTWHYLSLHIFCISFFVCDSH